MNRTTPFCPAVSPPLPVACNQTSLPPPRRSRNRRKAPTSSSPASTRTQHDMYAGNHLGAWLSSTYINADSQRIAATANERYPDPVQPVRRPGQALRRAATMSPATARSLLLIKLGTSLPAPKDPVKLAELTQIATPHGRHVRRRQVLHRREGPGNLPGHRPGLGSARRHRQEHLRPAARRLAGLAHDLGADAQGLRALRRTDQ